MSVESDRHGGSKRELKNGEKMNCLETRNNVEFKRGHVREKAGERTLGEVVVREQERSLQKYDS